jgi:hypothetical protein
VLVALIRTSYPPPRGEKSTKRVEISNPHNKEKESIDDNTTYKIKSNGSKKVVDNSIKTF